MDASGKLKDVFSLIYSLRQDNSDIIKEIELLRSDFEKVIVDIDSCETIEDVKKITRSILGD